ncbi:fumarylacetoacetate hydrolase family protein [Mesorhizobium sp. B3-1-3]|uniref:fumarylacetoacetate hydrolase family protein n=1 Tax=unclassified Mesorhizobium TaxID=325217 RepID=UPI001129056F|nr:MULTISPECIES: fumarylacetoacetate hydrolase family protein [unclassified Mesorhizobium]TPI63594.1 fumarylacetoacetate hydrolase family protein [Mesorhizobium sp. B3-1-7]TPI63807.1 fumarylacetoacetate hydrolase family protein [Mesorhizobium sp. B3-1-8]TPI72451.1 fumarylacetoacetate hydrolase family protein [Mesorhizobium sp. B3-1-3]TPJ30026.1 fumarylacetoacetate hydrolase family protein [Mesorhizobium sp. B2-8-3]
MRVATFSLAGERRVGLVDLAAQTVAPFDFPVERAETGLLALIERNGAGVPRTLSPVPLAGVEIEAPIPQPRRNIFCVGKNYYEHAHEFARSGFDSSAGAGAVPKHPIIFSKVPESVVPNHASVLIDSSVSTAIDYEAELAVIIGKGGRGISKEEALDHVWGYTIVNDVTARDLQGKYSQWLIGKSQDTFCPMGPWAVTRDEFDLASAGIRCFVNEDLRQDSRISLLIFDIPTIIATLSQGITLKPGDIIATGTPVGVGIGFDPPRYLKPGDVVRIEIDGIGTLENRFVERPQ